MGNQSRCIRLAGVVLGLASGLQASDITIRVYNYARVPEAKLQRAQDKTSQILRRSGVEAGWVECPLAEEELERYPECCRPLTTTHLVLAIVPRPHRERFARRHDVFGVAASTKNGFANRAGIYYNRVEQLARHRQVSASLLLGHIIAHEIGHLLLGAESHSRKGIMHAPWSRDELLLTQTSGLSFTEKQTRKIRQQVAMRLLAERLPSGDLNRDTIANHDHPKTMARNRALGRRRPVGQSPRGAQSDEDNAHPLLPGP